MHLLKKLIYNALSKLLPLAVYLRFLQWMADSKTIGFFYDIATYCFAKEDIRASRAFFQEYAQEVQQVIALLEDEKSKDTYRSVIEYRRSRKRRCVNPHMQGWKGMYFDSEIIVPSRSEVFIDCGAFAGECALAFERCCVSAGKPASLCVLFEPDPGNMALLQKNLPNFRQAPVVVPTGLWRQAGQCSFLFDYRTSSKIDIAGQGSIAVDSLDHALEQIPGLPPPTYIKMDIEGAEIDVLLGARKTIEAHRPRLAVAIYHSDEHMIKIPQLIHEMCPAYRFYVRHYSCIHVETVLYCICGEFA